MREKMQLSGERINMEIQHGSGIGLLEIDGICAAFAALDAAAKTADVVIQSIERTRDASEICIKMRGSISDIELAMEAAIEAGNKVTKVGTHVIIPAPTQDAEKMLPYSNIRGKL